MLMFCDALPAHNDEKSLTRTTSMCSLMRRRFAVPCRLYIFTRLYEALHSLLYTIFVASRRRVPCRGRTPENRCQVLLHRRLQKAVEFLVKWRRSARRSLVKWAGTSGRVLWSMRLESFYFYFSRFRQYVWRVAGQERHWLRKARNVQRLGGWGLYVFWIATFAEHAKNALGRWLEALEERVRFGMPRPVKNTFQLIFPSCLFAWAMVLLFLVLASSPRRRHKEAARTLLWSLWGRSWSPLLWSVSQAQSPMQSWRPYLLSLWSKLKKQVKQAATHLYTCLCIFILYNLIIQSQFTHDQAPFLCFTAFGVESSRAGWRAWLRSEIRYGRGRSGHLALPSIHRTLYALRVWTTSSSDND